MGLELVRGVRLRFLEARGRQFWEEERLPRANTPVVRSSRMMSVEIRRLSVCVLGGGGRGGLQKHVSVRWGDGDKWRSKDMNS